jgi:hypothetical protein
MSGVRTAPANRATSRIDVTTSVSLERRERPLTNNTRSDHINSPSSMSSSGAVVASSGKHTQEGPHPHGPSNPLKSSQSDRSSSPHPSVDEETACLKSAVQGWKKLLPFLRYEQRNLRVLNAHKWRVRRSTLKEHLSIWRERYV